MTALALLPGCANVSTTRFTFYGVDGGRVIVEMPKELSAKNLAVAIDAKNGTATVHADEIVTVNQGTIKAQGNREAADLNAASDLVGKGIKAGAEGAMKGVVP